MVLDTKFKTIYRTTGTTYYCRFIRRLDSYVWDDTNTQITAIPTWADSAVPLVEKTGLGIYQINIPSDLPTGSMYDVVVYLQSGIEPTSLDEVDVGFQMKHGGIFGF
jgi:hypothetical protein